MNQTHHIFDEISSQGQAWGELLPLLEAQAEAARDLLQGAELVLFLGCGSGLNAAWTAAPLFQSLAGVAARAVPAGELYLFPDSVLEPSRRTVAVLLSRSGRTTEVVQALDVLRSLGLPTLGITCIPGSPLANGSDLALVMEPAGEQAVATTRSLTGMILAVQFLAGFAAGRDDFLDELRRLPQAFADRAEVFQMLGRQVGQRDDLSRCAFVGHGPFYGLARECQLKYKEMTLLPSDAYSLLDFRHGPQSNVDGRMLVTAFLSDRGADVEARFIRDMKALGGVAFAICERAGDVLRANADYLLELDSGLSELARLPLCLPAVQFAAYYRTAGLGLDPDRPRNLSYWVDSSK